MSIEHVTRAQLAAIQVQRLNAEARTCTDLERLKAIGDEIALIHSSLLDIREEQLREQLERQQRPKAKSPRWWEWWRW